MLKRASENRVSRNVTEMSVVRRVGVLRVGGIVLVYVGGVSKRSGLGRDWTFFLCGFCTRATW